MPAVKFGNTRDAFTSETISSAVVQEASPDIDDIHNKHNFPFLVIKYFI